MAIVNDEAGNKKVILDPKIFTSLGKEFVQIESVETDESFAHNVSIQLKSSPEELKDVSSKEGTANSGFGL